MNWLFLALLAPFFWGFTNIIDRILTTKYVKPINYMILSGFMWLVNLVFLPWTNLKLASFTMILLVLFVGALRIFSYLFYLKALQVEEASRVVPLGNLVPIFVLIMSLIFLKESLTQSQVISFFLILTGGFILSMKNVKGALKFSKAIWFITLNTFLFALSLILLKFAYNQINLWDSLVLIAIGEAIGVSIMLLVNIKSRVSFFDEIKKHKKKVWLLITSSLIFALLGGVASSAAIMLGNVSLVAVIGGFQSLIVLLLATALSKFFPKILKEELGRKVLLRKSFGIIMMIIGLYFLYT